MNLFGEIEELKKYSTEDKKELAKKIFSYILSFEFDKNNEQYLDEILHNVLGEDISILLYLMYLENFEKMMEPSYKSNVFDDVKTEATKAAKRYNLYQEKKHLLFQVLFQANANFNRHIAEHHCGNNRKYYSELGLADLYEWFENYKVSKDFSKIFIVESKSKEKSLFGSFIAEFEKYK